MVIVHSPDQPHQCGPNRYGYWHAGWNDRAGTVRECRECGKSWVAYRPGPHSGYMGVLWRREGWLARRRRRRATPPVADSHPWQEYNAHGNTCHYPDCRLTEEEHLDEVARLDLRRTARGRRRDHAIPTNRQ